MTVQVSAVQKWIRNSALTGAPGDEIETELLGAKRVEKRNTERNILV